MNLHDIIVNVVGSQTAQDAALGAAGAAAMAATDWSTPYRALRHVFVGCVAAAVGADSVAPFLGDIIGVLPISDGYSRGASIFMVGATGIYAFEYIRAFLRLKIRDLEEKPDEGYKDTADSPEG